MFYRITLADDYHHTRTEILNALRTGAIRNVFNGNEMRYNKFVKIYYEHGYIALVFDSRKLKNMDGETIWHCIIDTLNDTLKGLGMWQRFYPNREGYGYFQSSIRLQPEERK